MSIPPPPSDPRLLSLWQDIAPRQGSFGHALSPATLRLRMVITGALLLTLVVIAAMVRLIVAPPAMEGYDQVRPAVLALASTANLVDEVMSPLPPIDDAPAQPIALPEPAPQVEPAPTPTPVAAPTTRKMRVLTTGYCPCVRCCEDSDRRTAINRDIDEHPKGIAADPKVIRYRTMIDVPGYGRAMVDDTGGAMRQSARKGIVHLDLRFRSHSAAKRWGEQWLWVELPKR